jgi:fructose-1,6-bisphosphatase/inositol monophosphatase family enzyme
LIGDPDAPCWVIDPIDGTTNFVRDIPFWCVSVGAVHQGRPVLGAISVPPLGEMYWAQAGQGAWLQSGNREPRRLKMVDASEVQQEDLIACNTTVDRVLNFSRVPCRLRNFGSLACHLALLARGGLCANVAHFHNIYDIAAGVCLCLEAGAEARYIDGETWTAQIPSSKETTPLLLAAPGVMSVLLRDLERV